MIKELFLKNEQLALDENASIWIAATAGGGKTSLVIKRILKLIVLGVKPEKILTITYTNEAINEIRNRITTRLLEWSQNIKEVEKDLEKFSLFNISHQKIKNCQNYFALDYHNLIEINTFHGFCFKIIRNFSGETNLTSNNLNILTENQIKTILFKIIQNHLIEHNLINIDIDHLLEIIMSIKKHQNILANCDEADLIDNLKIFLNLESKNREEIFAEVLNFKRIDNLRQIITQEALRLKFDRICNKLHGTRSENLFFDYLDIVLTKSFSSRKNLIKDNASLNLAIETEQLFLMKKLDELYIIGNIKYSETILNIFKYSFIAYQNYKKENNFIDFDDIIDYMLHNLKDSQYKEWILYQLNQRFHHFILDEAQDNSEKQWEIIKLITEDFFAGNSFEYLIHPTIFVVGDVKQSIYSFQNAEPDLFWTMKEYFKQKIKSAGKSFYDIEWNFSFRLAADIAEYIDNYFNNNYAYDLTYNQATKIEHLVFSEKDGIVENIACEPQSLVDSMKNKILEILEQDIAPEEIMVLFRSRSKVMQALTDAIIDENIKIYNSSKIKLKDKIETKLIISLNNFLLFEQDDYSLVQIIDHKIFKNEYIAPIDFCLIELRKSINLAAPDQITKLKKIIHHCNAAIYFQYLMNETLNQRINLDYLALKELLNLAHDLEKINIKTLFEFNQAILQEEYSIDKKNNNLNAIRFLTIHASKGLEAKVVLLYDDFSEGSDSFKEQFYFNKKNMLFYAFKPPHSEQIMSLKNEIEGKNNSENKRLLYVALTRAKEELYIYKEH